MLLNRHYSLSRFALEMVGAPLRAAWRHMLLLLLRSPRPPLWVRGLWRWRWRTGGHGEEGQPGSVREGDEHHKVRGGVQ